MPTPEEPDQQLQGQIQRLELVNRVARHVASTLDLDQVLIQVVQQVRSALHCYAVSVGLVEGDELVFRAAESPQRLWAAAALRLHRRKINGPGISTWVARTGEPLLVPDVSREPRYLAIPELPHTRSELAVPLKLDGQVVGVLDVQGDAPSAFDQEDVALVESLAPHIASAIRNAQLHQQAERRLEQMTLIHQTSAEIASQLELPMLLQSITERAAHLLGATGGAIYLYDPEREELEVAASLDPTYNAIKLRKGEGVSGRVIETGQPLIVADYRAWDSRAPAFATAPFRSVIAVPLRYQDRVIGTLSVSHNFQVGLFTEADTQLLLLLANQAAVAIENARLFEETRRYAQQTRL